MHQPYDSVVSPTPPLPRKQPPFADECHPIGLLDRERPQDRASNTHRRVRRVCLLVQAADVHVQRREVRASKTGSGASKATVDDLIRQTHCFEHLPRHKQRSRAGTFSVRDEKLLISFPFTTSSKLFRPINFPSPILIISTFNLPHRVSMDTLQMMLKWNRRLAALGTPKFACSSVIDLLSQELTEKCFFYFSTHC